MSRDDAIPVLELFGIGRVVQLCSPEPTAPLRAANSLCQGSAPAEQEGKGQGQPPARDLRSLAANCVHHICPSDSVFKI